MSTLVRRSALAAAAAVLMIMTALAIAPVSRAAVGPGFLGASVISSGRVKLIFSTPLGSGATVRAHYRITSPRGSLAIKSAQLADGDYAVVVRTASQRNARHYTVTATGVPAADGSVMATAERQSFVGTSLGPNSPTLLHDDFNRPSGLLTTDTPIPGLWRPPLVPTDYVSPGDSLGLTSSPALEGSGALRSEVTTSSAENDNALVRAPIKSANDYYISVYVRIPKQTWDADQEVGLLRLDQYEYTSHARLTAVYQSDGSWALQVIWKNSIPSSPAPEAGYGPPHVVARGLHWGRWYRVMMQVRNPSVTQKGLVQVWLNNRRIFRDLGADVVPITMTRAETGIMHLVTDPAAAHEPALVYFDQFAVWDHFIPRMN